MDVVAEPLTAAAFALYGDVIEIGRSEPRLINDGRCRRYHDLARLDFDLGGRAGVSLFHSDAVDLPYTCRLMERHPLGSQAFLPMSEAPFLVIVADDDTGAPVEPRAFLSAPGQGVNYHRNIWHGVLTPLGTPQTFTVVDWIGKAANLEEHHFEKPFTVTA